MGQAGRRVGATFAGLAEGAAPDPAVAPAGAPTPTRAPEGRAIALPRAAVAAPLGDADPARVLTGRRAGFGTARPLDLADVGALLYRAARVRASRTVEVPAPHSPVRVLVSSRPHPSGGALHEIEIHLVTDRCRGLASGVYRYDAFAHGLEVVRARPGTVEDVLAAARSAEPRARAVLVLTARFQRRSWKYSGTAYVNCLKNAGALLRTLEFAATAMAMPFATGPEIVGYADRMGADSLDQDAVATCVL
nr:SagB family peptide dehydrogenase [Actinopolymorpha rutila]